MVGIGLGGAEDPDLTELFGPVYEQARELGFYTSAHAGEGAGSESIWVTIRELRVDRIGHGTRAFEDPKLVEYLARRRIPLEVSLISNLRTGVVPNLREHPVRKYYDRGIPLSINTGDPMMFRNSLADEFGALYRVHGFSPAEIQKLVLGSLQNAWLSPANLLMINIGRSLNPYRPHRTQASKTGTANLEYLRRATLGKPILRAENDEFGLAYVVPMIVEPELLQQRRRRLLQQHHPIQRRLSLSPRQPKRQYSERWRGSVITRGGLTINWDPKQGVQSGSSKEKRGYERPDESTAPP